MATADPNESGDDKARGLVHRHRPQEGPITAAITTALAKAEDVDETEIDACLYDRVDPDAIDRLARHAAQHADVTWTVEFTIDGWDVRVHDDGRICVQ